eukprot:SAG22_NODE_4469_length_1259_cov_19.088793_2_plen_89_part_00
MADLVEEYEEYEVCYAGSSPSEQPDPTRVSHVPYGSKAEAAENARQLLRGLCHQCLVHPISASSKDGTTPRRRPPPTVPARWAPTPPS